MNFDRGTRSFAWRLAAAALLAGCAETGDGSFVRGDGGASDGAAVKPLDVPPLRFDVVASEDGGDGGGGAGDASADGSTRVCAAREVCGDGYDNDCNDMADDGCTCITGTMQPCYLAAPSTAGVGLCARGTQRCEGGQEFGRWSACAGSVGPSGERCDGMDNDCDGTVDNGCACRAGESRGCYAGPDGTRGVGLCRDGMQLCFPGPGGVGSAWGDCAGDTRPAMDVCDGMDNDCDGTVDNGCACRAGESRACYGGPMGTQGVGPCRAGTQTCASAGGSTRWGDCAGQTLPAAERCDGVDNDCDGMIDDGCACRPGETRGCYDGAMATRGVGACRDGTQSCVEGAGGVGATWGPCTGQSLPRGETCDEVDNNCDGAVDDGCACRRGQTQPCYAGPMGTQGVGVCRPGVRACVVEAGVARWGDCAGQTLPGAELCDSIDNNCNGVSDDGCACRMGATQPCYTGPTGTQGVGACRAGSQSCVIGAGGVGASWGACGAQTLPSPELCDGVDNNCNGMIDDGCACRMGATQPCYTGPTGTQGVGACRAGSQSCVLGAGGVGSSWGACGGQTLPATESCDGVDNDCDGMIDETCSCTPGATRPCYGGPMGTQDVGVCRGGTQTCAVTGGVAAWGACAGQTLPGAELCDSIDNNCNGMTDDGCACRVGATQPCYTGPTGTQGVGACRAGSQTCAAGAGGVGSSWGACGAQTLPSPELCDGVDNDCDGVIDNGCACRMGATQPCYTGPSGTSGVGLCRAGTQSCVLGAGGVGSTWGACAGQTLPTAEQCNTQDDNCNGMVDDGISCSGPAAMCPAPQAVPAGTVVVLSGSGTGAGALTYRWEVVSAPPGASFTIGAPGSATTTFSSVIVGVFTLRLTVTDAQGRTATCMTTVTMRGRGLRVELTWDAGVRAPTLAGRVDLDLHLHNRSAAAWFTDPEDCFFRNRTPRWDVRNSTLDDPSLDVDNLYGFGPENIRVDEPVPTAQTYTVGVNYFEGTAPVTATTATVRIYCGDVLRGTYTRRLQGSTALANANDFWRIARVTFSDASTCAVTAVDDVITTINARIGNP